MVTFVGAVFLLLAALAFIFFVGRGCLATQEATQVRKYVMSSNDLLGDSSTLGREKLQPLIRSAGGDPAQLDRGGLDQVVEESQRLYQLSLADEVPQEFEKAHPYLESTLGIRASATERLQRAASGDPGAFNEALATAVEDYRTSDSTAINHYFPASRSAIEQAGQQEDQKYLKEPRPFMDYGELGFDTAAASSQVRSDPNALHGVEVGGVVVAGQQLFQDGTVVLGGSAEPVFAVTVTNGGEVAETNVPVEIVLNTRAERQNNSKSIQRIEPGGGMTTVEIGGFKPGELDETADVTVEAGPVEYEELLDNNTLTGQITFGL